MSPSNLSDKSLTESARRTSASSRVLEAIANGGLRGFAFSDLQQGLGMRAPELAQALEDLTRFVVRMNGVYCLSPAEWARRIEARRADRFAGSAATFQRDVHQMLAGKGED